jgi:hypothetical protein
MVVSVSNALGGKSSSDGVGLLGVKQTPEQVLHFSVEYYLSLCRGLDALFEGFDDGILRSVFLKEHEPRFERAEADLSDAAWRVKDVGSLEREINGVEGRTRPGNLPLGFWEKEGVRFIKENLGRIVAVKTGVH